MAPKLQLRQEYFFNPVNKVKTPLPITMCYNFNNNLLIKKLLKCLGKSCLLGKHCTSFSIKSLVLQVLNWSATGDGLTVSLVNVYEMEHLHGTEFDRPVQTCRRTQMPHVSPLSWYSLNCSEKNNKAGKENGILLTHTHNCLKQPCSK